MNRVFILLGSNIDKERNLPTAVRLLSERCHLVAVSSVYETAPVGLLEQPNFFNAVVLIETELNALALKETILSAIEQQLHRQRTTDKNAPRTIDLDIGLFNNEVFDYGRFGERQRHIPDKDLLRFPHTAVPLAELAPNLPHPETGESFATIAARLLAAATLPNGPPPLWLRSDVVLEI